MNGPERGPPRRGGAIPAVAAACLCGLGPAGAEEEPVPFGEVVERLEAEVREAAPEGVTVEVDPATPADLGWEPLDRDDEQEARRLTVTAKNGVNRALGLLEHRGTYRPAPDAPTTEGLHARLVTVGPDVIVVEAPAEPPALTLEAQRRGARAVGRALEPVLAWEDRGEPVEVADLPAGIHGAREARRHAHYLAVELDPADHRIELERLWAEGLRDPGAVLVWRVRAEEGPPPPPFVAVRPRHSD